MAGHIITVKLTKAQAMAIADMVRMDLASGAEDMEQVFGTRAVAAAAIGAKRIANAVAAHEAQASREAVGA